MPGIGSVTLVGRVDLHDDAAEQTRFLETLWNRTDRSGEDPANMRDSWMNHMNTEGRLVGPVHAKKYITFDERKLAF